MWTAPFWRLPASRLCGLAPPFSILREGGQDLGVVEYDKSDFPWHALSNSLLDSSSSPLVNAVIG